MKTPDLLYEIAFSRELVKRTAALFETEGELISRNVSEVRTNGFPLLEREDDLMRLAVMLVCAEETWKQYQRLGVSRDIYLNTMDDIRIWCENNQNRGLKNYRWIRNHVCCELFRLKRLQFQMYCWNGTRQEAAYLPFSAGEQVIYIHIPQGEKLDYEACRESMLFAEQFFAACFPEYRYRYYFCESWLLYEGNRHFMDPQSNILKFAGMFCPAYSIEDDSQAIERIFGERRENISEYPENTSLRRRAKAYMEAGNRMGEGVGYIPRCDL